MGEHCLSKSNGILNSLTYVRADQEKLEVVRLSALDG